MIKVSINQLRNDIHGIQKILGERIVAYPKRAIEITEKVIKIRGIFSNSKLSYLSDDRLALIDLDELEQILKDANRLCAEYEEFLNMVGLGRANFECLKYRGG